MPQKVLVVLIKKNLGTFGQIGVLSFNGNKIITSGGGGCIITNDEYLAKNKTFNYNSKSAS